ncbi:uncharacterized protein C8A04DRAFT_26330 [Dichotomopilus funicola]|uniref:Zn(2)-C6 fungal-type domain-containing protein n=1 Tax=Dichotomopilus funicola TaxID=1934379 RepID=A0AAN6ZQW0_9PEZI|nr:hypothetical protein C8A04DRAFT_26330 [Dichotomopilus funicola]
MELAAGEPSIGVQSAQSSISHRHHPSSGARPGTSPIEAADETPANPRKRKKASRACDFCHVNHQPCDNGKPKCSVCTKHNKPCLYLRPTKRRGPQKGYRTALNTYKESAAAWGAVLGAIPGLDALIEGHLLRGGGGSGSVVASVRDSAQQDALVARWQESSVFRAFFGHNGPPPGMMGAGGADGMGECAMAAPAVAVPSQEVEDDEEEDGDEGVFGTPPTRLSAARRASQSQARSQSQRLGVDLPTTTPTKPTTTTTTNLPSQTIQDSLSDLVARDAARSGIRASETLASLGFAPDETIADFHTMGSNPEPLLEPNDADFDPSLGSEAEQRAYYELLMGRSFLG